MIITLVENANTLSGIGMMLIPLGWLQAALLGGSLLANAFGGRNKNKQNQNQSFERTDNSSNTGTISDFNFTQGTEDPSLSGARYGGLNRLLGLIEENEKPIYDENSIASVLNNINDVFASGSSNIASQLASVGGLDSGRLGTAVGRNELSRGSQVGNFFMQLPAQERAAKNQNLGGLLTTLLNFTGRGPQGQIGSSTRDINTQTTSTSKGTGQSSSNQGGGFLSQLLGSLGELGLDYVTGGGQQGPGEILAGLTGGRGSGYPQPQAEGDFLNLPSYRPMTNNPFGWGNPYNG